MTEVSYPAGLPAGEAGSGLVGDEVDGAAPWVERLARFGFASKGIVYLLVGGLALAAAIGAGGGITNKSGALASMCDSALGMVFLAVVAFGLFSYVLWRLVGAVWNPESSRVPKRLYNVAIAAVYAALGAGAVRMLLNGGATPEQMQDSTGRWSALLMEQPFGHWLLGIVGGGVAAYGLGQLVKAWRTRLDKRLSLESLSASARTWVIAIARLGIAARGVVFGIIGVYLVIAALQSQPSEARGMEGALATLSVAPWILGVIAAGLAAYGVYDLVRARYRVIRPS